MGVDSMYEIILAKYKATKKLGKKVKRIKDKVLIFECFGDFAAWPF
nr:10230_t:CDS:2 [Entrophospora candida]